MFNSVLKYAMILGLMSGLVACSSDGAAQKSQPNIPQAMNDLQLEWARTPHERQVGLMNRDHLADNAGMMFEFETTKALCFWMKNTRMPLSVGFIDAQGRLLQIEHMQPYSEQTHCSHAAARYALEVNQGWFERHQIAPPAQLLRLEVK